MTDEQKRKLEQKLWAIADTLRGKMHADEFRDYILGFIFYKYLSERLYLYANEVLKQDGINFLEIDEKSKDGKEYLAAVSDAAIGALGYFLKPSELFSSLAKRGSMPGQFILEDLHRILNNIERSTMGTESEDDFDDLFSDMDLTSSKLGRTEEAKNTLIAKVLTHLDEIDFQLEKADSDVLGDAYEYLIGRFASGAGKKAGEFYTPQEVSTILARIVTTGKTRLKTVYDPTCGSGSLLLRVAKEAEVGEFFGQEMNRTTYNLARMNMILHGVHYRNFDLKQEDTLEHPQHVNKRFEAVVANPPFSAQWSANPLLLNDDRYGQYGRLAPASKADFAFVQHMLHQLDDNGTMAVILPHGALFRGGAEGHIREYIIRERNWLDAVIGLPANIFYGTSIPTCVLVFKKCRENPNDILFVDASGCFEKSKNQNVLLGEHVDKIVAAFINRKSVNGFSHVAKLSEIAEHEYNLNIPKYVDTYVPEQKIELNLVVQNLAKSKTLFDLADRVILKFSEELGVQFPMGSNALLLEKFKRGMMQAIFSQRIRFSQKKGVQFPPRKTMKLAEVFEEVSDRVGDRDLPTFSISTGKGFVSQEERFGKDISGEQNERYTAINVGDFSYNKGNSLSYKYGCIYENQTGRTIAVPNVFISFRLRDKRMVTGYFGKLFESHYLDKGLRTLISSGARMNGLLNVNKDSFFKLTIPVPHWDEQKRIADLFLALDAKILAVNGTPTQIENFNTKLLAKAMS